MLRWRSALLWILFGAVLTAYSVVAEIEVREEMGTGFRRWVAVKFYHSDIVFYRMLSQASAVAGPLMMIAALLLVRRWSDERWLAWWLQQEQRHSTRAQAVQQQLQRSRSERKSVKLARRQQKLERRAEKCRRQARRYQS